MRGQSARLRLSLAIAALLAVLAPASAAANPRAMIAFLPTAPESSQSLLFDFADRGMTAGVTSPVLGGYRREQMLLDMSQGSRIARRAYDGPPPALRLAPDGRRIEGWEAAVRRAEDAPGNVVPGLLASAARLKHVAYVAAGPVPAAAAGYTASPETLPDDPRPVPDQEAIVAADREGRILSVSLGPDSNFVARALDEWRDHALVVARLPFGSEGLRAFDRLLAARGPDDLILAVRSPPPVKKVQLLSTGVVGHDFGGGVVVSDSTRRAGLVTATDFPVTVLEHLGVAVPDDMEGERIERRTGVSADDVAELVRRLDVVVPRRAPTLFALLYTFLGLVGLLTIVRGRDGLRAALRISLLAAMWLPGVALLTAAIAPSRLVEVLTLALASVAAGALTDRLVRWPLAPAVPAAVVFGAHAVDLAFGSPLIGQSLAGSSPRGGARFYGIGNELEGILSMEVLLGLGAALTRVPRENAPRLFALGCLIAALIMGSGRLGADVGAVITLGAGAAAAVLASMPGRPSRRAIAIAALVPIAAVVVLIALDLVTGGDSHLARTVLRAEEGEGFGQVIERRYTLLIDDLTPPFSAVLIVTGIVAFAVGIRNRERLLRPLAAHPAFAAGMWGAVASTIVGALSNDSGPIIFQIGFIYLALATGYVWSGPRQRAKTPA